MKKKMKEWRERNSFQSAPASFTRSFTFHTHKPSDQHRVCVTFSSVRFHHIADATNTAVYNEREGKEKKKEEERRLVRHQFVRLRIHHEIRRICLLYLSLRNHLEFVNMQNRKKKKKETKELLVEKKKKRDGSAKAVCTNYLRSFRFKENTEIRKATFWQTPFIPNWWKKNGFFSTWQTCGGK